MIKERGVAPRRVSLVLGDGSCLRAKLDTMPGDSTDFLMGEQLLYKYNALVDYAGHSLTFRMGGKHVRVNLKERE